MKQGIVLRRFDVRYRQRGQIHARQNVTHAHAAMLSRLGMLIESRPVEVVQLPDSLSGEELAAANALADRIRKDIDKLDIGPIERARLVSKCVAIHRSVSR